MVVVGVACLSQSCRLIVGEGGERVIVGRQKSWVASTWGGLWFPPRPVLVVRVVGHVLGPDPLGLVDERPLVRLGEQLPLGAEPLRDLGVVHLRVVLRYLTPLHTRPHHECVHRTLDVLEGGLTIRVGVVKGVEPQHGGGRGGTDTSQATDPLLSSTTAFHWLLRPTSALPIG